MPKNTCTGVILAGLSLGLGVGMIWYVWWLAAFSFIAIVAVTIGHTFNYHRDFYIPEDEVVRTERTRTQLMAAAE